MLDATSLNNDPRMTVDFAKMPTLAHITRYHAEVRPDAVALAFEGRETTFAAFDRRTDQVAAALVAAGVGKGRRIAYVGKNSDHYFELLFGAAKAGVVMAPIGWRLAPAEVAYIVEDAEAALVFVGPEVIGSVSQIRQRFERRRTGRGLDKVVRRLLGLDLKLAQYRDGARFCRAVVDRVGFTGFNQALASPVALPTLPEIHDPDAWLRRMGA